MSKSSEITLRVFSLNCWAIKYVSLFRKERLAAISKHLLENDYDIVLLQELWIMSDFDFICDAVVTVLPYSHYFESGIIGAGMCMLAKSRIQNTTFHEFSLCGYPHKLWEADWFGGKGLGVCCLNYAGLNIKVFTSHYHAEYNRYNDIYLGHRIVHATESANWIKLTSAGSDLTIYSGDFNTTPNSIPYKLLRCIASLNDAWTEDGGETSETPFNSFTKASALRLFPKGQRIDYIFYAGGPNVDVSVVKSYLPLPHRVPDCSFSFSDHEAVSATLNISPSSKSKIICSTNDCSLEVLGEAIDVIHHSRFAIQRFRTGYLITATMCLTICFGSFAFGLLVLVPIENVLLTSILFIPRVFLIFICCYCILMATLFHHREQRVFRATERTLQYMINCDRHE